MEIDAIKADKLIALGKYEAAAMLNLTRSEAQLMAGEMTAQEWRTVSAILKALQEKMRE